MNTRVRISLCALLLASACAMKPTEYMKSENGGLGYVDRELAPGKYEIQVRGNEATSAYTMERYFHRRATELCKGGQYDSLIKHDKNTQINDGAFMGTYYVPTTVSRFPMVTGDVQCK